MNTLALVSLGTLGGLATGLGVKSASPTNEYRVRQAAPFALFGGAALALLAPKHANVGLVVAGLGAGFYLNAAATSISRKNG